MPPETLLTAAEASTEGAATTPTETDGQTAGADTAAAPAGADTLAGAAGADSTSGEAGADSTSADGEAGEDAPQGAPETYADFTTPEGVELDTEVLDDFRGVARELNLPQEAAQRVVDLGVKLSQKWVEQQSEAFGQAVQGWAQQAQSDPEIGGAGFEANVATARRALTAFGSPEFTALLNSTGLGNHPEFIRAFAKIGRTITEDTVVTDGPGAAAPEQSGLSRLYPSMAKQS